MKKTTYDGDAALAEYWPSAVHWGSHMYQQLQARGEAPNEVMKLVLLGVSDATSIHRVAGGADAAATAWISCRNFSTTVCK